MTGAGRRFALTVAALGLVASVAAQQDTAVQPDAECAALLAAAQELLVAHDWNRATEAYQQLLTAARARNLAVWEGRAILGLGRVSNENARYADARRYGQEALAIFERAKASKDAGDAHTTLGIAAVNDETTAKLHYERAAEAYGAAGDERARVQARFRLFSITEFDGGSGAVFGQLQTEAHALGDRELEGQILHNWGDLLHTRSLYQLAIEKLEAAEAIFQETRSLHDLGTTYNSLGRLYRTHGQPAAALDFQLKALAIHETTDSPRLLIQSLNAVAVAFQMLGRAPQAREYYERALAAAERTGERAYIAFMTANLGAFLMQSDTDVNRGRELLERAMTSDPGFATSGRYTQLALAYRKLGRAQDSLAAAERALKACRTPLDCVYARVADGQAQLALGNDAAALSDQKEILAALEKIQSTLAASDFLKQNFQNLWEDAYSITIELHFRRGEFREALEAAEFARSRAFIDLLASRERDRSAPTQTMPAPPAPAGDPSQPALSSALPLRGSSTTATRPPSAINSLRSDASARPPTVDGLKAIAERLHATLLAYWVGANNVYVWVLLPDGTVRGASVSVSRAALDDLIGSIAPFAAPRDTASSTATIATRGDQRIAVSAKGQRAWRALYDLLIAPIENELPRGAGARLTIVPHGPLLGVPFAALRDRRGRYLVERFTIHSVPAGAVLQFTAGRVRADARAGAALLVGDPARAPRIPGEPPLPRLAGANAEVRAIARLLPAARTTMLSGSGATEPRVRDALPGKSMIHFATHAVVRDGNPLASFLAVGSVGDGTADGQLSVEEIYGLDLDAGVVVLSACRSGGGVVTGDGIAGLARAFFYAGTPSVIVSVWDVADQPTNRLLPAFYRHWLNGADKASALRAAQLALIRSLRAGEVRVTLPIGSFVLPEDPAFWAAFVLLGEPD